MCLIVLDFFQSACTNIPFGIQIPLLLIMFAHVCVHVCAQVFVHTYTRGPPGAHQPQLQFCVGVSVVTLSLITLCFLPWCVSCFPTATVDRKGKSLAFGPRKESCLGRTVEHMSNIYMYCILFICDVTIFFCFWMKKKIKSTSRTFLCNWMWYRLVAVREFSHWCKFPPECFHITVWLIFKWHKPYT